MKNSKINRREFIGSLAAAGVLAGTGSSHPGPNRIDRFALVSRHSPVLRKFEPLSPLSVGNGEFAFTCDVTGLQTFPDLYQDAMPLCTMSQWGWHTNPMPASLKGKVFKPTEYDSYGRAVPYITGKSGQEELYDWLRENPHRLHLGRIGLRLTKANGIEARPTDITDIEQRLDLWSGIITSRFKFLGEAITVKTAVHPSKDMLAVSVESYLISLQKIAVWIEFPYGSPSMAAVDWGSDEKHLSKIARQTSKFTEFRRSLDADNYFVYLNEGSHSDDKVVQETAHRFLLKPSRYLARLDLSVLFSKEPMAQPFPPMDEPAPDDPPFRAIKNHWNKFWSTGGAIELSMSKDPRAEELERRIILSQYLTAIQCAGSTPPQETGLTCNSWYGKFHLEMHWWHAAHFALWNRFPLLEKSLDWYLKILPSARERAQQQGYGGARWPKMTSPDGRDSPSPIGPLLIWQQPHPIFYAELAYSNRPTVATLQRYRTIVDETAEFMASYEHFDKAKDRYVLGPPVIPAQENHPPRETWNPTFELEYWNYGLKVANKWRERMGLRRNSNWDDIVKKLSPLPIAEGVYLAHENCPQTFTERNKDHPSMLGALGILRGNKVDRETMRRTLNKVMKEWDWAETWGWDYPMTAMTAARLGEPLIAIDALMLHMPKNHYLQNGHNYQRANLPLYLPGNGGLLYAIALMANGWKGSPKTPAPGFPTDGKWTVQSEGFDKSLFSQI